jgi:glycyl-tRNA synthetase alpha chain
MDWNEYVCLHKKKIMYLIFYGMTCGVKYKDVFYQSEKEFSAYNFEHANIDFLFKIFEMVESRM